MPQKSSSQLAESWPCARHSRLHGYALFDIYFCSAGYARLPEKQRRRLVGEVVFAVKGAFAAFYEDFIAFFNAHPVENIHALHNGFYQVVAVFAFSGYIKKKIELCTGF